MTTVPITAPKTPITTTGVDEAAPDVMRVDRRLIDSALIGAGVLAVVILAVAAGGHLKGIADGATYADLGATESAARADVAAAVDADQPQNQIDELQATAEGITAQRNSLFRGETLRGLLLSAYAWSTVGRTPESPPSLPTSQQR